MPLTRLIYVSSARARRLETQDLVHILESSARHNKQDHVTGMLLYLNGSFMQALEGKAAAVGATFKRIQRDTRHTGIMLIDRTPIPERDFDQWSMGFKRLVDADTTGEPAYVPFTRSSFDAEMPGARQGVALQMLKDFSLRQGV